jgi:hypothetical protein
MVINHLSRKPDAGKLACPVWSGGKAVKPYLSLQGIVAVRPPHKTTYQIAILDLKVKVRRPILPFG